MPNDFTFPIIAQYEGPCAFIQIARLQQRELADAQLMLDGVYAQSYWQEDLERIPCVIGKTYRITVEEVVAS